VLRNLLRWCAVPVASSRSIHPRASTSITLEALGAKFKWALLSLSARSPPLARAERRAAERSNRAQISFAFFPAGIRDSCPNPPSGQSSTPYQNTHFSLSWSSVSSQISCSPVHLTLHRPRLPFCSPIADWLSAITARPTMSFTARCRSLRSCTFAHTRHRGRPRRALRDMMPHLMQRT
jgi:hypothetical protein